MQRVIRALGGLFLAVWLLAPASAQAQAPDDPAEVVRRFARSLNNHDFGRFTQYANASTRAEVRVQPSNQLVSEFLLLSALAEPETRLVLRDPHFVQLLPGDVAGVSLVTWTVQVSLGPLRDGMGVDLVPAEMHVRVDRDHVAEVQFVVPATALLAGANHRRAPSSPVEEAVIAAGVIVVAMSGGYGISRLRRGQARPGAASTLEGKLLDGLSSFQQTRGMSDSAAA